MTLQVDHLCKLLNSIISSSFYFRTVDMSITFICHSPICLNLVLLTHSCSVRSSSTTNKNSPCAKDYNYRIDFILQRYDKGTIKLIIEINDRSCIFFVI